MPVDTFIAGKYGGTFNSVGVGITEQGFEIQQDSKAEMIEESDTYGQSLIDWIFRGGQVSIQFDSLAYRAGSIAAFWPYGTLGLAGVIGRLASNIALATVLTSTTGTPAVASPATLTATFSLLAPNNPARLLFSSKLRKVPVRLACLLYDTGGAAYGWFTTT